MRRMLAPGFTLEERARLGEEAAVRRHFDRHNLIVLSRVSWLFAAVGLGFAIHSLASFRLPGMVLSALALAVSLLSAFVLRRLFRESGSRTWLDRAADWIASHARGFTLMFLAFQYSAWWVFGLQEEEILVTFSVLTGLLLLAIRLAPSETILLYGGIAVLVVLRWFLAGTAVASTADEAPLPILIPMGVFAFTALEFSRRSRKTFLREWRAARVDALEHIRVRDELDFAREVQLSMLPREAPPIPWLDIASVTLPATEVGGDYYDYFPLSDGRFVCVIGDVAGHGLASGMVLSGIRSGLTVLTDDLGSPAEVMTRLDAMLRKTSSHRMFVTLSILLLDPGPGSGLLTSAGHPPLFLFRQTSGAVERIETASLPLGTKLPSRFDQRAFTFGPDDLLLLQTDGVYETANAGGTVFGLERVELSFAHAARERSLAEIRERMIRDLCAFRGDAPQSDDVTMVLLRIRGDAGALRLPVP